MPAALLEDDDLVAAALLDHPNICRVYDYIEDEAHDWLVLERGSELLGYAYAGRFRERAAYRFITESTIYLRNGLQGQGLGKPLYRATIERTFALGYTSLIGAIALGPAFEAACNHLVDAFARRAHQVFGGG